MKPPKDCPSVVHGSSPHSSRRSASASYTIWSWRKWRRYAAFSSSVSKWESAWASMRVDWPVPR